MAAICKTCGWSGTSNQVIDGGRCPECRAKVRYDSAPVSNTVLPAQITDVDEFNRRAAKALAGVTFQPESWDKKFAGDMIYHIGRAVVPLTEKQQLALYRVVHRYRRQITDKSLLDYAATHAREYE